MNKELQKSRMKKYFIDAAKEILVNEGVSNVSVRKVGEVTGYSYATIYNYFKNLDHLLWCTGL
ncbi:MAG: TetR/AcrR family transcriptional regulator, partial [Bacillota bacterium]|nr:TetR/AcrR family transcriptional regulator [Bacillota bacterium]